MRRSNQRKVREDVWLTWSCGRGGSDVPSVISPPANRAEQSRSLHIAFIIHETLIGVLRALLMASGPSNLMNGDDRLERMQQTLSEMQCTECVEIRPLLCVHLCTSCTLRSVSERSNNNCNKRITVDLHMSSVIARQIKSFELATSRVSNCHWWLLVRIV